MIKGCLSKTFDFDGCAMRLVEELKNESHLFFLDSSLHESDMGRYSFIGFDPFKFLETTGADSLEAISKEYAQVQRIQDVVSDVTPFPCGLMGFVSYDYGLSQEKIQLSLEAQELVPDCCFGFYDVVITIDHFQNKLHITSSGLPVIEEGSRQQKAHDRLEFVEQIISDKVSFCGKKSVPDRQLIQGDIGFKGNFTRKEYEAAVKKALDYISKGDIYQVNLSQRFMLDFDDAQVDKLDVYNNMRMLSASSFSAFFDCGSYQVMSNSPERFLKSDGKVLQTRPMKGTRPRGKDVESDSAYKKELANSAKDKAELLMITDLLRNDIGKVCEYGSVAVKDMRTIEEYSTVFQATSTVEGKIKKDVDAFDIIQACFPGGSITGCPKIRSMEIIEELEPTRRGIYTGALGYISFSGNMDLNILIRTMLLKNNQVYFQVGGGIVADSTPSGEYEETLVKAKAMKEALQTLQLKIKESC